MLINVYMCKHQRMFKTAMRHISVDIHAVPLTNTWRHKIIFGSPDQCVFLHCLGLYSNDRSTNKNQYQYNDSSPEKFVRNHNKIYIAIKTPICVFCYTTSIYFKQPLWAKSKKTNQKPFTINRIESGVPFKTNLTIYMPAFNPSMLKKLFSLR